LPGGDLLIENLHDVGKIKTEYVQATIEPDLVYPLIRGRDIRNWKVEASAYIILAQDSQTRVGISETEMKHKYPKTYSYFMHFEKQLRQRSGYRKYFKSTDPFWSMYNVGSYTLSPWKVVWRDMGTRILPAVIHKLNSTIALPEHHVMFVSLEKSSEAHFLAGAISSLPSRSVISAYTTLTGISTHILENVSVPKFNPNDTVHLHIADLSEHCHDAIAGEDLDTVATLESEIDKTAARLWGITYDELKFLQDMIIRDENDHNSKALTDNEEDE